MNAHAPAAVVTVSDGVTSGTRTDESGDVAQALLAEAGFEVTDRRVVPDERLAIEAVLRSLAESHGLVVTTGGTGFGPRDVTPEATRAVIAREAPGLAELMRTAGLVHTPMAALSRAVAGTVGDALVVNLPGSPKGVREALEAILPVVPHAMELMAGAAGAHPTGHASRRQAAEIPRGAVAVTAIKRIGAPPCPVGARIVLGPGGPLEGTLGCAEFDAAAAEVAAEVLASGEGPGTRTFHHELGDLEVFVEPDPAPPVLLVISANPVALELLGLGKRLGYRVILVEPRTERILPGHRVAADGVVASLDLVQLDARADAVHTDHDAPELVASIATLLRSSVRFVGVMGSRRHVGPHVEALRTLGFGDADLVRVRSPVGLDLGAKTSEEIALSIAAGLVAARTGRDGGWLDR